MHSDHSLIDEAEELELRARVIRYRTTAVPSVTGWIPFFLMLVLAVVAWQSWQILSPGFARLQSMAAIGFPQDPSDPTEYVDHVAAQMDAQAAYDGRLSILFSPQVLHWRAQILEWSDQFQLDPNLVAVVMQIESCGYPEAQSSAGAMGLFQVMPYHFDQSVDPFDPGINAQTGLGYLARAFELSGGQIDRTLAGYNGGHGVIPLPTSRWSSETIRYVQWGTGILSDINAGMGSSPTLQAWLDAGGSRLCHQASTALQLPTY